MTDERVWRGATALEPFLVPIDDLEPFPGNPRRGDLPAIRASLRRFGQTRAVLVDASNQRRIIAAHHVRLAALEEGWTHIAVIPHEFADEDEARAYLLADNRTHDLGAGYDTEQLVEQLKLLADADALAGTGYTLDDLDDELARLHAQMNAADAPPPVPPPPPAELREVVLFYSPAQHSQIDTWLRIVAKELGTDGVSETVFAMAGRLALELNQGTTPA